MSTSPDNKARLALEHIVCNKKTRKNGSVYYAVMSFEPNYDREKQQYIRTNLKVIGSIESATGEGEIVLKNTFINDNKEYSGYRFFRIEKGIVVSFMPNETIPNSLAEISELFKKGFFANKEQDDTASSSKDSEEQTVTQDEQNTNAAQSAKSETLADSADEQTSAAKSEQSATLPQPQPSNDNAQSNPEQTEVESTSASAPQVNVSAASQNDAPQSEVQANANKVASVPQGADVREKASNIELVRTFEQNLDGSTIVFGNVDDKQDILTKIAEQSDNTLLANLAIKFTYISKGEVEAVMPVTPKVCRNTKSSPILNGGASAVLAETAAGMGSMVLCKAGTQPCGINVSINHVGIVFCPDTLVVRAKLVRHGNVIHTWNVDIYSSKKRGVIATAHVANMILREKA